MYKAKSDVIRHDDLVEDGALRDFFLLELKEVAAYAPVVDAAIKKMAGGIEQTLKGLKVEGSSLVDIKKINEETKKANDLYLLGAKFKKLEAQANTELERQRKAEVQVNTELEKQRKAKIQADKAEIELNKKKADSVKKELDVYGKLSAELAKAKREAKNLGAEMIALERSGNKNTTAYEALSARYLEAQKNASALNDQVKKLDASVGDNQRNVGNYTQSIKDAGASVLKWAGALGIAISAKEIFNKAIESTQVLSDNFAATMKGLSQSTDYFFRVLTSGDWSGFLTGLRESYKEGRRYAESLDLLADKQRALNVTNSDIELEIERLKGIAKLKTNEISVRRDAVDKIVELEKKKLEITKKLREEELANELQNAAQISKLSKDEIKSLLSSIDVQDSLSAARQKYDELQAKSFVTRRNNIEKTNEEVFSQKKFNELLKQQPKAMQDAINAELKMALITDASRKTITDAIVNSTNANKAYEEGINSLAKLRNSLNEDLIKNDNEAVKKRSESLAKLLEIERQANEDLLKAKAETNEEKVGEDYRSAVKEIDAIEATEKEKYAARQAVDKKYRLLFLQAQQKDEDEELNRIKEAAQKRSAENEKQAEKDFKIASAQLDAKQAQELQAIEEAYAKQKNKSVKEEEAKQRAILEVKLKYLELEKLRNADNLEEVAKIEKQIADLRAAYAKLTGENLSKEESDKGKLRKKLIQKIESDLTEGIRDGLKTRSELIQQADQRDIDMRKRTIEIQTQLAAEGRDNVLAESLAAADRAEEKKLADAKRAQEQQANIELTKIFFNALDKAMEKDGNPILAFGEALGEVGLAKTIISRLLSGGFYEGTESLSADGKNVVRLPGEGKDNLLIRAHEGERIMGVEDSKAIAGLSNKEVKDAALMYMNNDFERLYIPNYNAANTTTTVIKQDNGLAALANVFAQKIDSLERTIENKPVQQITLGSRMGEYEEQIQRKGITIIKAHTRKRTSLR